MSGSATPLPAEVPDPRALPSAEAMLERAQAYALLGFESSEPHIGRFAIRDTLGRGGMGVVLAAHDPKLDRMVALKLLDDVHDNALREARALARISHPNIVGVYEVGEAEGRSYIAMELVEGTTVRTRMETRGAHDRLDVLKMFLAIGRGLMAAHAAGIVHRDLKPDNVLVDREGRPRIVDFGLSTVRGATDGANGIAGTPAYMAPEGWRGEVVDERSDQFGFCVALFEALYRHRPFEAPTMAQLSQRVLDGELRSVPPKERVNDELHAALLRGLSVNPNARWPSMAELIEQLQHTVERAQPGLFRERPWVVQRVIIPCNVLAPIVWLSLELLGIVEYSALAWLYVSAFQLILLSTALVLARRFLAVAAGTRRVLLVPAIFMPLLLAHRVVALVTGSSVEMMFVYDFLVIATVSWGITLIVERGMWPVVAFALALAGIGTAVPDWAPRLWLVFAFGTPLMMVPLATRAIQKRNRGLLGAPTLRS